MESYRCFCGAYTTNEDGICDVCVTDQEPDTRNNDSVD